MFVSRSKRFKKEFKKLPAKIQEQFGERLRLLLNESQHPLLHTHALTGEYRGYQSFNVTANIRAIFVIQDTDTIHLFAIGSHSELYE